ncbi:MAG: alkaline phosphatase family protein [Acidobacteriota bacterium]
MKPTSSSEKMMILITGAEVAGQVAAPPSQRPSPLIPSPRTPRARRGERTCKSCVLQTVLGSITMNPLVSWHSLLLPLCLHLGMVPVWAATRPGPEETTSKATSKRKVILIGLDGTMPEYIDRYRDQIPELDRLVKQGFFSPAIESPYTDTATNWNTIATGAWVGTHGITSFNAHLPGMLLGEDTPTFNTQLVQAEYLWHAAERQGKRTILINYPTAFPKLLKNGVVVGGDGLSSKNWTVRSAEFISSFRELPHSKRLIMQSAQEWTNVPRDYKVLREGVVLLDDQQRFGWGVGGLVDEGTLREGKGVRRYVLAVRVGSSVKVLISDKRDAKKAIALLGKGEWSGWIEEDFDGKKCLRQYKVLDLNLEGTEVTIYGTMAAVPTGWGFPAGVERRVIENAGAYVEALELTPDQGLLNGWFGRDMALEIMNIQAQWAEKCAAYLSKSEDWDLMAVQYHAPDGIAHLILGDLESPDTTKRQAADEFLRDVIRRLFQMVDTIKRQCADENTFLFVVSDHGNLPKTRFINVVGIMMREGWTKFAKEEKSGLWFLDPKNSLAAYGNTGVWINLKGREKEGVVNPGQEYESLRRKVIERLRRVTDPLTGEDAFSLIGKREELEQLGLWGERIEDILSFPKPYHLALATSKWGIGNLNEVPEKLFALYRDPRDVLPMKEAIEAGYIRDLSAVHWGLPTASVGYASNRAIFMLSGPGVEQNKRAARVNLVDVAATISHCLGIRPPDQCEGRIVWQAFSK